MSNATSFRLPINVRGLVHDQVAEALENHDDAINDLQQAIQAQGKSSSSSSSATVSTSSSSSGSTQSVTIASSSSSSTIGTVNNQTGVTAYTTLQSDYGSEVQLNSASAIAVSLSTLSTSPSVQIPWFTTINNLGTGTATITPLSGTINGVASIAITSGQFAIVYFDGTDFTASVGASGGGVTKIVPGANVTISPIEGTGEVTVNATGVALTCTRTDKTGTYLSGVTYTNGSTVVFEEVTMIGPQNDNTGRAYEISSTINGISGPINGITNWSYGHASVGFWVPAGATFSVRVYQTQGGTVYPPASIASWTEVSF